MNATGENPVRAAGSRNLRLAAAVFAGAASLSVVLAYAICAWILIKYPWDWSPDEGLYLDYARRLLAAPATLFHGRAVPLPASYTRRCSFPWFISPILWRPRACWRWD